MGGLWEESKKGGKKTSVASIMVPTILVELTSSEDQNLLSDVLKHVESVASSTEELNTELMFHGK